MPIRWPKSGRHYWRPQTTRCVQKDLISMTFGLRIRFSRKAGLHPPPERVRRHHPDFDKLASEGWKSLEAEGKLSDKAWRKEQQWSLDMGLPGAECLTDKTIPTFARGELPHFAGINIFLSSYRFNKPVLQVSRAVVPMQILLVIGLLLITYIPALTTFLPRWLGSYEHSLGRRQSM